MVDQLEEEGDEKEPEKKFAIAKVLVEEFIGADDKLTCGIAIILKKIKECVTILQDNVLLKYAVKLLLTSCKIKLIRKKVN